MLINSLNRRTVSEEQDRSLNISYYVKKIKTRGIVYICLLNKAKHIEFICILFINFVLHFVEIV